MATSTMARRWALIAAVILLGAGFGITRAAAGPVAPKSPIVLPPPPALAVAEPLSKNPSVSSDGRWMVFAGAPTIADGRNSTVSLRDAQTGVVTELTTPVSGTRLGDSVLPAISGDGCEVVVVSQIAFDLFRDDDTGSRWDVYRIRQQACGGVAGDWELVSSAQGAGSGSAGDDASPLFRPAISGSGSVVAYVHRFSSARGATTAEMTRVALVDLTVAVTDTARSVDVSGTPAAAPNTTYRYRGLRQPSLSDDGTIVAFTSDADSAATAPAWATGPTAGEFASSQVFVWNRPAGTVVPASTSAATAANGEAAAPAVSGDGRYVAFQSAATNLVTSAVFPACSPVCLPQIYRFDRTTATRVLVSRKAGAPDATAVAADAGATQPAISADGGSIAFVSRSSNLFAVQSSPGGGPSDGDVVLATPATGALSRVSLLADGVTPAASAQSDPQLSADGRTIVFDTLDSGAFVGGLAVGRHAVSMFRAPTVAMADLDLGSVSVGLPGSQWWIGVVNRGPAPFLPATITSSNPDFAISPGTVGSACTAGVPVAVGATCTVDVVLTPSVEGPITGTITIAEAGFGAVSVQSHLVGAGGSPVLAISLGSADLGSVLVGQPGQTKTFDVTNIGFGPANITTVTVAGANPKDFAVKKSACLGAVDIGQKCSFDVAFTPTGAGQRSATITVTTDAGVYTSVVVNGTGNYEAKLLTLTPTGTPGAPLVVGGSGFPAHVYVTLLFSDGAGGHYLAATDAKGAFLTKITLEQTERPGQRTLVAQTVATGETAATDLRVLPNDGGFDPGNAAWPRA